MDLNSLLADFTGASQERVGQLQQAQQGMDQDTARIQALLTTNEVEQAAGVQQAMAVAGQEAQINYTIGKAKEANAAIAGMDPDNLNNEYNYSLANFDVAESQRTALERARTVERTKFDELSSVNLLDNPLAYIAAQLQIPGVAARHNATLNREIEATDRRDAAHRNVVARTELVRAKDSIIAANTADAVLAANTEKAKLGQRQAEIQLRQAQADNISKIGARAMESLRVAGEIHNVNSDMLNKQMSMEQFKASQAAAAEARAARREEAAMRFEAAKEKQEDDAAFNASLAAASLALGYSVPVRARDLKHMKRAEAEALVSVAQNQGTFGGNLAESLTTVTGVGNMQAIATTNPGMAKFVQGSSMAVNMYTESEANKARTAGSAMPKQAELVARGAEAYQADVESSASQYGTTKALNSDRWDKVHNPYKPQYLALVNAVDGGAIPQLKDNKVVAITKLLQKDLAPGADNLRGEDMTRLLQVLAKEVGSGTLGIDTAAKHVTDFHRVAAAQNKKLFNYTQFGLQSQTSAIVNLPAVNTFGEPFKIDLMDNTSVKKELSRMVRDEKRGTVGGLTQWAAPKVLFGIDPAGKLQGMIERERAAAGK